MTIIVKSRFKNTRPYVLRKRNIDDYCEICCLHLHFYDSRTGEPVNLKIAEMDDCIKKNWNPKRFVEIFSEISSTEYEAFII